MVSMEPSGVGLDLANQVTYRFLCAEDVPAVRRLCEECFPIKYPDSWFEDITANDRFFSLAALRDREIIGMIVAEVRSKLKCNSEDSDILASWFPIETQVVYILSLGVSQSFRKNGIASLLLTRLLSHLTTNPVVAANCRVVYLHVLWSNDEAIQFYERRGFRLHTRIRNYYAIHGQPADGYTYVLYINGGEPPMTLVIHRAVVIAFNGHPNWHRHGQEQFATFADIAAYGLPPSYSIAVYQIPRSPPILQSPTHLLKRATIVLSRRLFLLIMSNLSALILIPKLYIDLMWLLN